MQEETQPNYTCPPDRIPNKDSHSSRPVNGGGPPARLGENPNQYQLTSNEVQVTYTPSNDNGQPELGYQGSHGTITFTGNDIRSEETMLGTLLTVFLVRTVDTGSVTLTLLVPGVNLAGTAEQAIQTVAIETHNLFSILDRNKARQTQTYQVYNLQGTAQHLSL